ncbi:PLP-dependent aminotransferase family protein [Streptomyces xanthochromogenes]|uniref:aminotransferase-like domain-containing protein n=1 Tax=Streptomyces xanthochromogenes TaxID=67384 RepID=UPI0034261477
MPASPSAPAEPAGAAEPSAPVPALAARAASVGASPVREILALTARPEVISFAGGLPAPELFDGAGMAAAFRSVLDEQAATALQYSTTEGSPALRAATAERLAKRGLATGADDLLITTGSQQGLTLLAAALLEPGDVVVVEDPCYLAALQVFGFAGARVVAVPCDEDGPDPVALDEIVARERPKLFYCVPTFQNPTGRTMTPERRRAVADVAVRRGLWIVEDDPYGELRYEGEHVPWISSYEDAADRTVLLSSYSKIMAPGLRIGWLRAPRALLRACVIVKQASDLHTPTVNQLAAARYLTDRDLDAHLAIVRAAYGERRDAMLAGLGDALPDGSTWNRPQGGMFLWVRLPSGWDATAVLRRVIEYDVAYVPGAPFFAGAPDPGALRLCFVTSAPGEIREGLDRLGRAFNSVGVAAR